MKTESKNLVCINLAQAKGIYVQVYAMLYTIESESEYVSCYTCVSRAKRARRTRSKKSYNVEILGKKISEAPR